MQLNNTACSIFKTVNSIPINKYLRVVYVLRRQPILCLDPNHL